MVSGRRFGIHSTHSYYTRARQFLASCMPLFHRILLFAPSVVIHSINRIAGFGFYLYSITSFCSLASRSLLIQNLKYVQSLARPCLHQYISETESGTIYSDLSSAEKLDFKLLSRSKQTSSCPTLLFTACHSISLHHEVWFSLVFIFPHCFLCLLSSSKASVQSMHKILHLTNDKSAHGIRKS